ncbi:MAG: prokaryotic cytochrome b561 family protein [Nevskia sp.]|nr:prokaryotic cytochrome b561 family protein [Nevskia sp.]
MGYGVTARLLHWLVLVLIAAQYVIAWTMPDVGPHTLPTGLIAGHLSLGALILLLVLGRVLWRLSHPVPPPPDTLPPWQGALSRLVHLLLYATLLLLPLMGWGNASSRGWEVTLAGYVHLPALFKNGSHFGLALGDIHAVTAIVLLVLIGLHSAAALYHHFIVKDQTLMRMLPRWSRFSCR